MRKCEPIIIPKGIRFISDWEGYRLEDYGFPHILNKVLTGCGYTEYCLRNGQPIILTSPRIFLIENKEDQHQKPLEVFRVNNTVEKITNYETDIKEDKIISEAKEKLTDEEKSSRIEKLHHDIREYIMKCGINHVVPKILVTYDSFRHVKEALGKSINNFQVVVDEFQSIFIDARFKSSTEIELLYQLRDLQKICFVSATPMLDKYLEMLDEFKDLPYYEFDWSTEDPMRMIKPKLEIKFTVRSLNEEAGRVIQSYKDGRFDTRLGPSGLIESKEAVLFFNSVAGICQAIRSNKLHIEECNVMCARNEGNEDKVRKAFNDVLKKENPSMRVPPKLPKEISVIGKIPKRGEPHKMFTFCTRTVYLGADFYSTNAKTFIFSDANIDCLSVDISMDLEQILGRQRLDENPWKNCAKMFVKTTTKNKRTTKEEFEKRLEEKKESSIKLLETYKEARPENKQDLAKKYQRDTRSSHYKYDYIAVNEHAGSGLVPVFNNLMMVSEMRSFEVQQTDYADRFSVFNAINEKGVVDGISDEVLSAAEFFNNVKNNIEKLRLLVELSEKVDSGEVSKKDLFDFLSLIPPRLKDYYIEMGPDRIRANGFRETRLKEEWNKKHREESGISDELVNEIYDTFKLGQRYTNSDIKEKLKELYQKHGYDKTAKASDLEEIFWIKKVYIPSIKKHGIEIQGKR